MKIKTEDLLIQQNDFLQRQNDLIEQHNLLLQQQNKILQQSSNLNKLLPDDKKEFVENLYTDEMRNGFLVTSHRKKLWNVQIGLINEFARICKKHNLRWFAEYGTLLGAARHKGFIPWDDDVDLVMLRPDYAKFKQIAAEEIKYPYYMDNFFDYRSGDDKTSSPEEEKFPKVSNDNGGWPFFDMFFKIRDSRTTMIEFPNRKNVNQGIWIDVFVWDPLPPFENDQQMSICNAGAILNVATLHPQAIQQAIEEKQPLPIDLDFLQKFLKLSFRQKGIFVEKFLKDNHFPSEYVGRLNFNFLIQKAKKYKTADFENLITLPFEKIEILAPANYDEHLKITYGDWRKMVFTHVHVKEYSTDIPYTEYFRQSAI